MTASKNPIAKRSLTLTLLRQIVQEVSCAQDLDSALNIVVKRVHETMTVDVCSVYLTDNETENHILLATEGLNPAAVGRVRLRYGEGLVGLVAERSEPINEQDASSHPRFKLIPQCSEEPYHAFLGVPVIHRGTTLGVFVVQQVAARRFSDSDEAFLITLAAQLAGVIALAKASGVTHQFTLPQIGREYIEGIAGAPGVGMGVGFVVSSTGELDSVPNRISDDPQDEERRFRSAVAEVVAELRRLETELEEIIAPEDRALFGALALIAGSDTLMDATVARIHAGNWAPGALRETIEEHMGQFASIEDPYIRERAHDIHDLGQRILARLQQKAPAKPEYPENAILIADNLSPVDLVKAPADRLAGVISGHGSSLSHLSILARAMGLPAVVGVATDLPIKQLDGRRFIVDGYRGRLYVDPSDKRQQEYARLVREERELTQELRGLRDLPAESPDGQRIALYTNAGVMADISHSLAVGAEGIGLYRTELPFMLREQFPSEEEQRLLYRQMLKAFDPRPVTLRTLDIGGDKKLPYFPIDESNPVLGWRGIRLALDNPVIFLTQLRAMLRASAGLNNLRILLPMVSGVEEVEDSIGLVQRAYDELKEEGVNLTMPPCGVMIEIPSAVYQAEPIARRVDFLSVGTNDLTQYLLAVDRGNERVARLFDSLHPAVLQALLQVVEAGRKCNKPVNICGEAAGDPAVAILLLAMGVESLSMSASDLPRIKSVIRSFSREAAQALLENALEQEKPIPIREMLNQALNQLGLGGLVRPGK